VKLFGLVLIAASIIISLLWVMKRKEAHKSVVTVCFLTVFTGLALILNDRITELTFPGVGTIKAATEQATADAKTIADLKTRVENQSATVDLVATQAASAKALSEQVVEQNKLAAQKLDTLDKAIKQADAALSDIKSAAEFIQTVVAAQNDDRNAFDRLEKLAQEKSSAFSERAHQAWNTIFNQHTDSIYNSNFTVPWNEGVDPSKFSLADLTQVYTSAATELKPALLEYISNRSDTPERDRLDFLMKIMKSDPSLTAAEYAGRNFTRLTNLNIKPLAIDYLSHLWNEHRQEFASE
jgi:hypothetical protein